MINIQFHGETIDITGRFDFGYMGQYPGGQIRIYDTPRRVRGWKIVSARMDGASCSDEALSACLTEYFNSFERKLQENRKQVNDCFLIKAFEDMEGCGYPFWEIEGLTRREYLPADPDEDVYQPHWEEMSLAEMAFWKTPNDGSLEKPDAEALLRKNFPALDWDALLASVVPEHLGLHDGGVSFQCSDGFEMKLLCGAYDWLNESLTFTDWHNF